MGVKKIVATIQLELEEAIELVGCLSSEIVQLQALEELGELTETLEPVLELLVEIRAKIWRAAGLTRNLGEERIAIERAKYLITWKPGRGDRGRE